MNNAKKMALSVAFGKILKSYLEDIGTLDDWKSIWIIHERNINRIVPELIKEVSIRTK